MIFYSYLRKVKPKLMYFANVSKTFTFPPNGRKLLPDPEGCLFRANEGNHLDGTLQFRPFQDPLHSEHRGEWWHWGSAGG